MNYAVGLAGMALYVLAPASSRGAPQPLLPLSAAEIAACDCLAALTADKAGAWLAASTINSLVPGVTCVILDVIKQLGVTHDDWII